MTSARARTRFVSTSTLLILAAMSSAGCGDGPTGPETISAEWHTTAVEFRGQNALRVRYSCPPNGTADLIWGTDVYTDDSSVCTAGVHVGRITLEQGGQITIEILPGQDTYIASARNGIISRPYGIYNGSFIVQ